MKPTSLSSCSASAARLPTVLVINGLVVQESIWGQEIVTHIHVPGTLVVLPILQI